MSYRQSMLQKIEPLPFEIVENIIETAVATLDAATLSSIALVSHDFHHSANNVRFSSAIFDTEQHRSSFEKETDRIHELSSLIDSGKRTETLPGVHTFITSFILKLNALAPIGALDAFLKDGSLAFIFNNLFRIPPTKPSARLTLSIEIADVRNDGPEYGDDIVIKLGDWRRFGSNLSRALIALIRTSHLNDLRIVQLIGIPTNFLLGARLKHLLLHGIGTDKRSNPPDDPQVSGPPTCLESLSLDMFLVGYKTLSELVCSEATPTLDTYTSLKSIIFKTSLMMPSKGTHTILSKTQFLESVCFDINGRWASWLNSRFAAFNYQELTHLKSIRVNIKNLNVNPFPIITAFLGHTAPPSLETIQINLRSRYEDLPSVTTQLYRIRDFRQQVDVEVLDSHLVNPIYRGIKTIDIRFITQIYQYKEPITANVREQYLAETDDFKSRIMNSFPKIREANPTLTLRVTVW